MNTEFDSTILKYESAYGVNALWVKALIAQESSFNPNVIRYEAAYSYLCSPTKFINAQNSLDTEMNAQRISWGLGQLMGAVARELGHVGFMTELLNPEINIVFIYKKLQILKQTSNQPEDVFCMYNGGKGAFLKKLKTGFYPNAYYVSSLMTHLNNTVI